MFTNIKYWVNHSGSTVHMIKRENNQAITIQPGAWIQQDVIVPWADNEEQFARRAIVINCEQPPRTYFVWQHGPNVCYSTAENWADQSWGVPGECREGGDRQITFDPSGNFVVKPA